MKRILLFSLLVFVAKANFANFCTVIQNDSLKLVKIAKDQIFYNNKLIGNIKSEKISNTDSKSEKYSVKVFQSEGSEIAHYEIEVASKGKKNPQPIKEARLITFKDKVVHSGTNFVNFNFVPLFTFRLEQQEVPQLAEMVDYLIEHDYIIVKE